MTTETDPGASSARVNRHRVRRTFAALAGLLAVVALVASVVAIWARNVVFDSGRVAGAVDAALQEPAVTDAMAVYLTDQVLLAIGAEDFVAGVLPAPLQPLTPALVGGVRSIVSDRMANLLAEDSTRRVIVELVERSHGAAMDLLNGDGLIDGVTVVDGEVTINLLPLLTRGLLAVQEIGLLSGVEVPTFSASGDPAEQRAELAAALDRDLPPTFGELVVYRSDTLVRAQQSLAAAQQALVLVKRGILAVMMLAVLAFAAAILLSVKRGRSTLILLLSSVAALVITRAVVRNVVADAPELVLKPGARAAISSTLSALTDGLINALTLLVFAGVVAAIVVFLAGDHQSAAAVRNRAGAAGGSLTAVVTTNRPLLAFVAFVAAALLIFFAGLSTVTAVIAVVLALVGAWALLAPTAVKGAASGR